MANLMPQTADEFDALLLQARGGDESALMQLAKQYEPEVRIVAHVMIGRNLRPYLDSLDLVQSVHKSLLLGLRSNRFDISSPEKLVALAVTMVRNKVIRHWRHLQKQQRLGRDIADDAKLAPVLNFLISNETDPAKAAQLQDALHQLWRNLVDAERRVIELRLAGHTTVEAADALGMNADVLRVQLSRLRKRLRAAGVLAEWL